MCGKLFSKQQGSVPCKTIPFLHISAWLKASLEQGGHSQEHISPLDFQARARAPFEQASRIFNFLQSLLYKQVLSLASREIGISFNSLASESQGPYSKDGKMGTLGHLPPLLQVIHGVETLCQAKQAGKAMATNAKAQVSL